MVAFWDPDDLRQFLLLLELLNESTLLGFRFMFLRCWNAVLTVRLRAMRTVLGQRSSADMGDELRLRRAWVLNSVGLDMQKA
jgi:hypothetical protein